MLYFPPRCLCFSFIIKHLSQTSTALVLDATACGRSCKENGKALVADTMTAQSYRLVVMPEERASG